MVREYHKCANPDCVRLAKRHKRCGVCRRNRIYICQDCRCDIDSDCAVLCIRCRKIHHDTWCRLHQKPYNIAYRLKKKNSVTESSVIHNNIPLP